MQRLAARAGYAIRACREDAGLARLEKALASPAARTIGSTARGLTRPPQFMSKPEQPETEHDHEEQEPRDHGAACRPPQRYRDRRSGRADLPDHVLSIPQHGARGQPVRAQGLRQHLLAHHEPHLRCAGAEDRRARRRRRRVGGRFRAGGLGHGRPEPVPARRQHRQLHRSLRRHLEPVRQHAALHGHHRALRRSGRSRGLPPRHRRPHPRLLRRDAAQSQAHCISDRRGGGDRALTRRSPDHGQHGSATDLPAIRSRRGHRRALHHQVRRRTRHLDRRHDRRRRQLRLGGARQALPDVQRTRPQLPRRDLERGGQADGTDRLHHPGPRGPAARYRLVA